MHAAAPAPHVHYRTLDTLSGFRDTSQSCCVGFQRVNIRADTMPLNNEPFEIDKGDKPEIKPRSVSASGAYDETHGAGFLAS